MILTEAAAQQEIVSGYSDGSTYRKMTALQIENTGNKKNTQKQKKYFHPAQECKEKITILFLRINKK